MTWRRVVLVAGALAAAAIGTVSIGLGDLEGGAVTIGLGLATWVTRIRRGTVGAAVMAVTALVTLYFMSTAAVTNIREGSPASSVVVSSILAAVALLALLAAAGFLVDRASVSSTGPWLAVAASVLLLGGLVASSAGRSRVEIEAGDIALRSENMAFSETELTVITGVVAVSLENKDLFWHTFTIEELGVDLRVPVGAKLGVTFEAPPGEYQFICAIPGHAGAGMTGTLIVKG